MPGTRKYGYRLLLILALTAFELFANAGCGDRAREDSQTSQQSNRKFGRQDVDSGKQFMDNIKTMMDQLGSTISRITFTGNFDRDFAGLMIEHHETGINIIDYYMARSKDTGLKNISQSIKSSQVAEKSALAEFLRPVKPVPAPADRRTKVAYAKELLRPVNDAMTKINNMTATGSIDRDFALILKEYLSCGIEMTNSEMRKGTNDNVITIAYKIKDQRTRNLGDINKFLK